MDNRFDDDWSRALRGETVIGDNQEAHEGAIVRKVLLKRREELNRSSGELNSTEFENIKHQLSKLGLLKRKQRSKIISYSLAFIAGITSTLTSLSLLLVFGLQPTLQGVRSGENSTFVAWIEGVSNIGRDKAMVDLQNVIDNKQISEITINEHEVLKLASFVQSEATKNGMLTKVIPFETGVVIYLSDFDSKKNDLNELKLVLGLNPLFSGPVKLIIHQAE